ncbi:MAG: M23 family metallopeptidase, partial [Gemmataceae bacterium]|nr:M23 family metallopeptidase [Gemmataceae bacterium]
RATRHDSPLPPAAPQPTGFSRQNLSQVTVKDGEAVRRGETIAKTGNSGNASGLAVSKLHLHFEIRTSSARMGGLTGRLNPAIVLGPEPPTGN